VRLRSAAGQDEAVLGRVILNTAAPLVLPAPGQPFHVTDKTPRGHLHAQLRWATPDTLRQLSLSQYGFNVYRMTDAFVLSRGYQNNAPSRAQLTADVVAANAARGAQALRSLEECVPLVAAAAAGPFEQLRYRLYRLEHLLHTALRADARLGAATVCVLVDGRADQRDFLRLVETLLEAGVRMLQIRDKALDGGRLVERARGAVAVARRRLPDGGAVIVVNDRADVAVAADADGVHVGKSDLPVAAARRVIGPRRLLGRTAHDLAEARAAVEAGADYLGVGPCFPSTTKRFEAFAPPEFLRAVPREIGLPAFAIGGITLERLDELAAAGIERLAVASAGTGAADPAAAAAAIIDRWTRLRA